MNKKRKQIKVGVVPGEWSNLFQGHGTVGHDLSRNSAKSDCVLN